MSLKGSLSGSRVSFHNETGSNASQGSNGIIRREPDEFGLETLEKTRDSPLQSDSHGDGGVTEGPSLVAKRPQSARLDKNLSVSFEELIKNEKPRPKSAPASASLHVDYATSGQDKVDAEQEQVIEIPIVKPKSAKRQLHIVPSRPEPPLVKKPFKFTNRKYAHIQSTVSDMIHGKRPLSSNRRLPASKPILYFTVDPLQAVDWMAPVLIDLYEPAMDDIGLYRARIHDFEESDEPFRQPGKYELNESVVDMNQQYSSSLGHPFSRSCVLNNLTWVHHLIPGESNISIPDVDLDVEDDHVSVVEMAPLEAKIVNVVPSVSTEVPQVVQFANRDSQASPTPWSESGVTESGPKSRPNSSRKPSRLSQRTDSARPVIRSRSAYVGPPRPEASDKPRPFSSPSRIVNHESLKEFQESSQMDTESILNSKPRIKRKPKASSKRIKYVPRDHVKLMDRPLRKPASPPTKQSPSPLRALSRLSIWAMEERSGMNSCLRVDSTSPIQKTRPNTAATITLIKDPKRHIQSASSRPRTAFTLRPISVLASQKERVPKSNITIRSTSRGWNETRSQVSLESVS